MIELNNRIASLEMRAEQFRIHLQYLSRQSRDAEEARSRLYAILQELAGLKADREHREAELEIA
jgi:hypothetical protein